MCRGIDLQMRLCQRVKAGRTPDPAPAPPAGPRPLAAQAQAGHPEAWLSLGLCRRWAWELWSPSPVRSCGPTVQQPRAGRPQPPQPLLQHL